MHGFVMYLSLCTYGGVVFFVLPYGFGFFGYIVLSVVSFIFLVDGGVGRVGVAYDGVRGSIWSYNGYIIWSCRWEGSLVVDGWDVEIPRPVHCLLQGSQARRHLFDY